MWRERGSNGTRGAALALVALCWAVSGAACGAQEAAAPDDGLRTADLFVRLFAEKKYDGLNELMDETMRGAMTPEVSAKVRADLVLANGELGEVGDAWFADAVEDYRRFRVPVAFERRTVDLLVVLDGKGRVAGFFHVPHVPAPSADAPASDDPVEAFSGLWQGTLEAGSTRLPIEFELAHEAGGWMGTSNSPAQGATGLLLSEIRVDGAEIELKIAVPGDPTFRGRLEQGKIRGTLTQFGQALPLTLSRSTEKLQGRPQEPRGPLPYREEDVAYENGDVRLAGTLTLPEGQGPFPAVLLLTGSGAQNRDEEVFGHKPFLVLADHLTRAGIAVLRVDDRGIGGSTGDLSRSTVDDLAADALAGVGFLRQRAEVDAARIGLLGHSEGGIVAPLAASRSDRIAFVVLLAAPGVPGHEILVHQLERISLASGMREEDVSRIRAAQRKLLDLLLADADREAIETRLRELTEAQLAAAPTPIPPGAIDQAVAQALPGLLTPAFRAFVAYDPRPALREVDVPVLALDGELDLQVDPAQNLPEIRKALEKGGNPDFTLREMPGLNHLFQKASTGLVQEYATIDETLNAAALETVRDWILERFGPERTDEQERGH